MKHTPQVDEAISFRIIEIKLELSTESEFDTTDGLVGQDLNLVQDQSQNSDTTKQDDRNGNSELYGLPYTKVFICTLLAL